MRIWRAWWLMKIDGWAAHFVLVQLTVAPHLNVFYWNGGPLRHSCDFHVGSYICNPTVMFALVVQMLECVADDCDHQAIHLWHLHHASKFTLCASTFPLKRKAFQALLWLSCWMLNLQPTHPNQLHFKDSHHRGGIFRLFPNKNSHNSYNFYSNCLKFNIT